MMTKEERKRHVSPFLSKAWQERKENIETRILNKITAAGWRKEDKYENK